MPGLFNTLSFTSRALQNYQTAVQTIGHNIANANTEGYSRQRVDINAAPPQWQGYGMVGQGSQIANIERIIDRGLLTRMQFSESQVGFYEAAAQQLSQVEALFNEGSDNDLSSALEQFFNSLNDLTNNPEDIATRTAVIQSGGFLADTIQQVGTNLSFARTTISQEITVMTDEINRLGSEIAQLNEEIQRLEGGGLRSQQANDLRDRREQALRELANLVNINTHETSTGVVNVVVGSDFLVLDDDFAEVGVRMTVDQDSEIATPVFAFDNKPLDVQFGKLAGLMEVRDTLIDGYLDDLDLLANGLIFEMNKLQVQGRGLVGNTHLESAMNLSDGLDQTTVLSQVPFNFAIQNGSFDIIVVNELTSQESAINIDVDLDGLNNDDATLGSLVTQINAKLGVSFPMVTASINSAGSLVFDSSDQNFTFHFQNDTSNMLAAVGLNRFFAGSRAIDIVVAPEVRDNPQNLSAATSVNPGDNSNAVAMAQLRYGTFLNSNTTTFEDFYQGIVGTLGVESADYTARSINQDFLNTQLKNERESLSGVNLDEEATNLITFQRSFQAAARVISVVDELLQTLLSI